LGFRRPAADWPIVLKRLGRLPSFWADTDIRCHTHVMKLRHAVAVTAGEASRNGSEGHGWQNVVEKSQKKTRLKALF